MLFHLPFPSYMKCLIKSTCVQLRICQVALHAREVSTVMRSVGTINDVVGEKILIYDTELSS